MKGIRINLPPSPSQSLLIYRQPSFTHAAIGYDHKALHTKLLWLWLHSASSVDISSAHFKCFATKVLLDFQHHTLHLVPLLSGSAVCSALCLWRFLRDSMSFCRAPSQPLLPKHFNTMHLAVTSTTVSGCR